MRTTIYLADGSREAEALQRAGKGNQSAFVSAAIKSHLRQRDQTAEEDRRLNRLYEALTQMGESYDRLAAKYEQLQTIALDVPEMREAAGPLLDEEIVSQMTANPRGAARRFEREDER